MRRFHDANVFHADLKLMNIVVSEQVYLIDFDRGMILPSAARSGWKESDINRFERSLNKSLADLDAGLRTRLWEAFLNGYRDE